MELTVGKGHQGVVDGGAEEAEAVARGVHEPRQGGEGKASVGAGGGRVERVRVRARVCSQLKGGADTGEHGMQGSSCRQLVQDKHAMWQDKHARQFVQDKHAMWHLSGNGSDEHRWCLARAARGEALVWHRLARCGYVGMPARNDSGEVKAGCLGPWAGGETSVEEIKQDGEMAPDVARFVVDLEHGAQALQRCARATQSLPGRRKRHSDDRHADKENGMRINTCDGERPMR